MRILQISPDFPPWSNGGAAETFSLLADAWREAGHEVLNYTSVPNVKFLKSTNHLEGGLRVFRLLDLPSSLYEASYFSPLSPRAFFDFKKRIGGVARNCDLVVVHGLLETMPRVFWSTCPEDVLSRCVSVQYGVSAAAYSPLLRGLSKIGYGAIGRLVISRIRNIVVFCSTSASEIDSLICKPSSQNVHKFVLGIDTVAFANQYRAVVRDPFSAREWLGARSISPPFIFSISRNTSAKGQDLLVDAFADLAQEFPDLSLVLAGEETVLTDQMRQSAARRGIGHRVRFLGKVSAWEKMVLFQAAQALVIPSRVEGYGLTALQARLIQKPTVATDTGAHRELLRTNPQARLVVPGDVASLREGIRDLIRGHPASGTLDEGQLEMFDIRRLALTLTERFGDTRGVSTG